MPDTPTHFQTTGYPAEHGSPQLTVRFEIFRDEKGGCSATLSAPEGSTLVAKYGGKGRAVAACRDFIIADLDLLIRAFHDEE